MWQMNGLQIYGFKKNLKSISDKLQERYEGFVNKDLFNRNLLKKKEKKM